MDKRIFGIENEYGVMKVGLPQYDVVRRMFMYLDPTQLLRSAFLLNGARLYIDTGDHPEYASAECDSVAGLIAQDKAGERILEGLALRAEEYFSCHGSPGPVHIYKNNTDSHEGTYGCHENYLVSRKLHFDDLTAFLLPFLATRQLCVGAGKVLLPWAGGPGYSLSQRARHMRQAVSAESTRGRPLINTRDEPHADPQSYRRLHLIVGDANMSETTTLLKIASTDLVLRMFESGVRMPQLALANPVLAIEQASRSLDGEVFLDMADGRKRTPAAIQREYLAGARWEAQTSGRDGDALVRRTLDLWDRALTAVETRDHTIVRREIDWAIKLDFLERYRTHHGLEMSSPRLAQLDLAYHDINRNRGLYYQLESRGAVDRVVNDLTTFEAKVVPPQTTRARLRGEFLRDAPAFLAGAGTTKRVASADWVQFRIDRGDGNGLRTVNCPDPFRSQDPRIDALRESMRR